MNEIWCNGQWCPANHYPGAAQDRGAILGLGLFETMLCFNGVPVFADRHLARLQISCAKLGWSIDLADFKRIATELLLRNALSTGRARLRLVVTAGSGPHNDLTPGADRLVWISVFPAGEIPVSMSVCLAPWPRNERSPLAGFKSASYAENLVALDHARRMGCDETIFLNTQGNVCEAATANLFLVKNGVVATPPLDSGCLPGIGREVICSLATEGGIALQECSLTLADLHSADEIFLISATRGPIAVTRFEQQKLSAGPVTAAFRQLWQKAISV